MAPNVIITRPKGPYAGDEALSQKLIGEGFHPISLTSLAIEARELAHEELQQISSFVCSPESWIVFLSPTSGLIFQGLCAKEGWDLKAARARIASQGAGTSQIVRDIFGRDIDLEATTATAESFARHLSQRLNGRGRVLVPQSADGRDVLGPLLGSEGNEVVCISTYGLKTFEPSHEEVERVRACGPQDSCIVFMSPSAVRATADAYPDPEHLSSLPAISIGPSTSQAMRELGLKVSAEADPHTESGVVACIKKIFSA
jgi:uroporphyrinogen-III synthase